MKKAKVFLTLTATLTFALTSLAWSLTCPLATEIKNRGNLDFELPTGWELGRRDIDDRDLDSKVISFKSVSSDKVSSSDNNATVKVGICAYSLGEASHFFVLPAGGPVFITMGVLKEKGWDKIEYNNTFMFICRNVSPLACEF